MYSYLVIYYCFKYRISINRPKDKQMVRMDVWYRWMYGIDGWVGGYME